tara:strand:+ start:224 stop:457 length:234 start_codon:yes stop_codon:yes gene_type:complete
MKTKTKEIFMNDFITFTDFEFIAIENALEALFELEKELSFSDALEMVIFDYDIDDRMEKELIAQYTIANAYESWKGQ